MEKFYYTALAAFCIAASLPSVAGAQSANYPSNFAEDAAITNNNRYVSAIKFTSSDGTQTIAADQKAEGRRIFLNRLDNSFSAKAGESVTASFNWTGDWMCGYAYIDLGNDGNFDVDYDDSGVNQARDLMTYSMYKNRNSNGANVKNEPPVNPPAFTIPEGTAPGFYRMRYKIDWDCVDPGGNTAAGNDILKNGGVIVDTRINIHGETVHVTALANDRGKLLNADGSELQASEAEFGKDLTLKVEPKEGYFLYALNVKHGYNLNGDASTRGTKQWSNDIINVINANDGICVIPASYIDGDVEIAAEFIENTAEGEEYKLNFDPTLQQADPNANKLTSFSITPSSGAASSIDIPEGTTVYRDLLDTSVSATPGSTLTPSIQYEGSDALNAYLYIDYNQDGALSPSLNEDGSAKTTSELVAFSSYNNKNSLGEEGGKTAQLPSFKLPDALKPGFYRARLKLDSDNIDPAGDYDLTNILHIDNNNGYIVDFLLNVHEANGKLEVNSLGGNIVGGGNSGIATTCAYGSTIPLLPLAPADGYDVESVKVRHGHNLDGAQYVHGNRQWEEYDVEDVKAGRNFTIAADKADGDVRVTAQFAPNGTEEYKQTFAEEFNAADGSLPDANVWHNCSRENPAWKRFTSQTAEGQRLTAYIKDGKFVARAMKNTIAEEGEVGMISGAIESSDKMYFTYGRIEGRIRTNPHTGNFPAFWLMPQDNSKGWPYAGEIDIWEQIDNEYKEYNTVHTHVTYDLHLSLPNSGNTYADPSQYHVLTLDWQPTIITWYLDGKKAFSYAKSSSQSMLDLGQWPFDKPFYVILNQSVGSDNTWPKHYDDTFTYETLFDYVRLYQKDGMGDVHVPTSVSSLNADSTQPDAYAREGGVLLVTPTEQRVDIFNIAGCRVFSDRVQGNRFVALVKGVYIVGGKKLLVK